MDATVAILAGVLVGVVAGVLTAVLVGARMRGLEARLRDSDQRLGHALTAVQQMLVTAGAGSQETLSRLSQQLSEVGVTARQLAEQTQRLGELREALRAPGPRGGLGEVLLENLLRDVLPGGAYDTQFTFRDGTRVDAVVRLGDRLIPIDAKFPLTAFEPLVAAVTDDERRSARRRYLQAIRQHVDAVRRYVRPDEGTVPYALMYLPGEHLYYEMLRLERGDDPDAALWRHAQQQRVAPVSPNTLYVYLHTVALGLQGPAVERRARAVHDRLARLTHEFGELLKEFDTLGTHLRNARGKYDDVERTLARWRERLTAPVAGDAPLPPAGEP